MEILIVEDWELDNWVLRNGRVVWVSVWWCAKRCCVG